MALAWCAHKFLSVPVHVAIINHQLQDGSRQVAELTARRCTAFGLNTTHIVDVDVISTRLGLEADARQARYDALSQLAQEVDASKVLTAHTSDDVAETIVMRILRSPSIEALTGIAQCTVYNDVEFVRPWLDLSRADTTEICQLTGVEYWDDPTNGDGIEGVLDESYPLRSRIRHDILPLLSYTTGRDVRAILADSVTRNREDLAIIESQVSAAYNAIIRVKDGVREIKIRPLKKFNPALQRRVISRALEDEGITPSGAIVSEIIQLSRVEQKKRNTRITSALCAQKVYDVIQLWEDR